MATQNQIFRDLKLALTNSPPSRLKEMSPEATNNFSNAELYALDAKLAVIRQFISNQLKIRKNRHEELEALYLPESDKKALLKALKKGQINGSLR